MRKREFILVFGMTAVLAVGGLMTVLQGQCDFSENENRYLSRFPVVRMSSVLSGEAQEDITDAFNDQFPARDFWTSAVTRVKKAIGFHDIGGVYLGKDYYYFEKIMNQDISQTNYFQNLRFVNRIATLCPQACVTAMLIPSPGTILSEKLPAHAVLYDAGKMYEEAGDLLQGVELLDIRQPMKEAEGQVYYRTDHHWTQYGAYIGYSAYSELCGEVPRAYDDFDISHFSDSFYGTLYSKALDAQAVPDEMELPRNLPDVTVTCDGKDIGGIYDESKKDDKDKYAVYFGGNFGEVEISVESPKTEKRLLVIKDSFANSMIPFLLSDYEEIRMLDMRYFKKPVGEYLEEYGADEILVLFEMSNFAQDEHLNMFAR